MQIEIHTRLEPGHSTLAIDLEKGKGTPSYRWGGVTELQVIYQQEDQWKFSTAKGSLIVVPTQAVQTDNVTHLAPKAFKQVQEVLIAAARHDSQLQGVHVFFFGVEMEDGIITQKIGYLAWK